ncbi:high affinity immunoglobulin gamma Fc receptor I-like [Scleropages formosus]|uniref:high affinity immunoglobulin gamma Fc receptor I-like n=1 Tax=Scleropages formosus TaxID=113540 RepID=UPI0010FAC46E|nr:high affinity immunoglobulin gamma Fc receptor I-like [Scleropages formosus]
MSVSETRPKPLISVEPPWTQLFIGDPVTLSCGLGDPSAGWRYRWFKDSPEIPVSRRAALSAAGDRYTIRSASVSDQGQYRCRAERGNPSFGSELSDVLKLDVSELLSPATLTVRPNRAQHFAGQSLSLSCVVDGSSTGLWTVRRHVTRSGVQSVCEGAGGCEISPTTVSHSGLYWCESGSGAERSPAVNILVHSGYVILDGPVQPLTEGDSLTLTCVGKYYRNSPIKGAQFYKDGQEVTSSSGGQLTIGAVGQMDSGSYRCQRYSGEQSAEMWVTVRALISTVTLTVTPEAPVRTGVTLNFTCVAPVNKRPPPALNFSLLRDNITMSNSTVSSSTASGRRPQAQWSSLIENAERSHAGTYRCRVTGPTGLSSDGLELQVAVEESVP